MTSFPCLPESLVAPVLMYHEIARPPDTKSRLAVSPAAFEAQLSYLHSAGFTTITAAQLAAILAGDLTQLPSRPIVLTFDDGFEDFHSRAMPLLSQYGFTATVFVTTGWVQDAGAHSAGRRPGRMLTWSQAAEAVSEGIEVAAHSRGHPELDQLSERRLREELYSGKAELEDRLGIPVPGLAYPFGYSNARVRHVAREAGHSYACAVRNVIGPRTDLFALPRLTIRQSTRLATFQQIAACSKLQAIYRKDRALTRGWAVARRTRATWGSVARGQ